MPVKVRCSGCEKVLNAPDKLRGKTVKCPKCQSPIKIPAPQKKKQEDDPFGDDFLADLDLSQAEDESQRICPRCGAGVSDDDIDCPACGASLLTTGGAVAGVGSKGPVGSKKKKGPNKALFFQSTWADAWKFLQKNKGYAIRTGIYLIILYFLYGFCAGMVGYCTNIPPKVFWGLLAFVFFMAPIGWIWHLVTETIKASLNRSDKLKRVNFDFFTCVALGIKYFIWTIVFGLPVFVPANAVGGWLIAQGSPIPGLLLVAFGAIFILSALPVAMTHMAMPQQLNGWLIHKVLPGWARSLGAICYWLLIAFVTYLPVLGVSIGMFALAGQQMMSYVQAALNGAAPAFPWVPFTIYAVGMIVLNMMMGAYIVFNARIMGQIAYYYNQDWDLNTLEKQIKYKAKPKPGEEGARAKINRQGLSTVATGLNLMLLAIVINVLCQLAGIALGFFETPPVFEQILGFIILGCGGVFLIGVLLCFATPPEAKARGFLFLSFASPFIAIILAGMTIAGMVNIEDVAALAVMAVAVVGGAVLLGILTFVFFILYLKRLSEYLYYFAGGETADSILFLYVSIIGLWLLIGGMFFVSPLIGLIALGVLGLVILGLEISILAKLVDLLGSLKEECHKAS